MYGGDQKYGNKVSGFLLCLPDCKRLILISWRERKIVFNDINISGVYQFYVVQWVHYSNGGFTIFTRVPRKRSESIICFINRISCGAKIKKTQARIIARWVRINAMQLRFESCVFRLFVFFSRVKNKKNPKQYEFINDINSILAILFRS